MVSRKRAPYIAGLALLGSLAAGCASPNQDIDFVYKTDDNKRYDCSIKPRRDGSALFMDDRTYGILGFDRNSENGQPDGTLDSVMINGDCFTVSGVSESSAVFGHQNFCPEINIQKLNELAQKAYKTGLEKVAKKE